MTRFKDNYPQYLKEYRGIFEPLFKEAKRKSEFNLIMSLLAIRGMSDAGWEPFENTEDVFAEVYRQNGRFKNSLRFNILLWLYVHLIECSEHYELVANLVKTIKDEDYIIANHKNKDYVNLRVSQKIDRLSRLSKGTGYENVVTPFKDAFSPRFRNAIGHGDYALKSGSEGGMTVIDDTGFPKLFSHQEVSDLVNKAMALHVALRQLKYEYISKYKNSKVIKSSNGFGHGTSIDITLIVRRNYGVIGFRCIGGYDLGKPFETRLVKALSYEMKMIESGVNELPPSRIDRANAILKYLPSKLAIRVQPFVTKLINR